MHLQKAKICDKEKSYFLYSIKNKKKISNTI